MNKKKLLKLNIQKFAEGEEGGSEDAPVMTFDEILADKTYQSEYDRRVKKALDTAKSKWELDAEAKRTEAQKLAQMDADEKHKYEIEKANKEKLEALERLNSYELERQAVKLASEKKIDISLLSIIDYSKETADSIKTKLDVIEQTYKKSVETGINDVLKQNPPKQVNSTGTTLETDKMTYSELVDYMEEHPDAKI